MKFLRASADTVRADPALRLYGIALSLLHILTFAHWRWVHPAALLVSDAATPVCWPFFEDCAAFRFLTPTAANILLAGYLTLGVLATLLFMRQKTVLAAMVVLALACLTDAFILFQDYRLRLNQHYMAFWVTAVFLLMPDKRRALQFLITALYFWAGTLKFDPDWLSGAALFGKQPWLIPGPLLIPSLWYALVLETVVVFGLLADSRRRPWLRFLRWGAFAQLALFHVSSWGVVGFFYPLLGLAILSLFPLCWCVPAPPCTGPGPLRGWAPIAVVAAFSCLQVLPHLFPGDSALTGEGRLFALHMFDARVDCDATAALHGPEDGVAPPRVMRFRASLPTRIACDPIVYLGFARALCARRTPQGGYSEVDLKLRSKRARDAAFTTVVDIPNFCGSGTTYDMWRHNPWIAAR